MATTIHLSQFQQDADRVAADSGHRRFLRESLSGYTEARSETTARFADWQAARDAASAIKWDALERLDTLIEEFAARLQARGTNVCWARNADEAIAYMCRVFRAHSANLIVKSKTMTSEEIRLNEALEADGYRVVESDLGEFIVQLRGEPPYHFVFPAMHLKRDAISDDFAEKLGSQPTHDPEELTMIARRALRETYLRADIGITGANFGIAETGMISITENEGNARLTMGLPHVHIALMGIEKVLPRLDDLALFLPMLATCGTGQRLTAYNTLIGGPRQPGECDGPEEFHVVLLDNRRTNLLADPSARDALRCIRCGACLNVCPIFKNVGGHTYGTTYQGPIGSVITPHLAGMNTFAHLAFASSLCGACSETCPVRIDLHHLLLHNREVAQTSDRNVKRLASRAFAWVMTRPRAYLLLSAIARRLHRLAKPLHGSRFDPLRGWRRTRTFPDPAQKTFHAWWRSRNN